MTEPGEGFAKRVTRATLDEFKPLLRVHDEPSTEEEPGDGEEVEATERPGAVAAGLERADPLAEAEARFNGERFSFVRPFPRAPRPAAVPAAPGPAAPPAPPPPAAPPAAAPPVPLPHPLASPVASPPVPQPAPPIANVAPVPPPAPPAAPRPLLWRKRLSATDAQRQTGHKTGDLRLTQANFKVGGAVIDQTTYFRGVAFGTGNWQVVSVNPHVEAATFNFEVDVMGTNYGVHALTVSHKPTGAAGQGNYTSNIRWGGLQALTQHNVTGRTLELYGPAPGTNQPYRIVIS